MVLIYCSVVAELSIKILIMALLKFCHYSSDLPGAFTIKFINNDFNEYLCMNQVSFLDICFCFVLSLSRSPLPKSHSL
jgi:hypothetical protein